MTAKSDSAIPSPREHLGFEVGEDRKLADWSQIVSYFDLLAEASDRVQVSEIGKTTEGAPLVVATISSPANLAELERYRAIQEKLADPRKFAEESEAEDLIATGKAVVLVTCSIHGTEVGAAQMSMLAAHQLATGEDARTHGILDNVIFLLMPCLNPDGLDIVKGWYDSTLGTPHEGVNPPFLYNTYTGHDNNRDWFMFTQAETRLTIEHCHNAWHPHIVFDLHQTRSDGMRLILPPFIDPIDPHVDPILQGNIAMMGTAMAAELTGQGKAGVGTNVTYDNFSPSRAYQHYHGGIRILSEAASAKIATPIDLTIDDLSVARGADPFQRTWNHPMPWQGGRWSLRDIVDYDLAAVMACLGNAARYREVWLRNFLNIGKRAIAEKRAPFAYLIPVSQRDPVTATEMMEILQFAQVELHEATEEFTADGITYPAETRVVPLAQPYGVFARTMLGVQHYPNLRQYEGGPPKQPYDSTAHSLPLQMGVETVEVKEPCEIKTRPIAVSPRPEGGVSRRRDSGTSNGADAFVLRPDSNAAYRAVFRLLAEQTPVSRTREAVSLESARYPAGAFVVGGGSGADARVTQIAIEEAVTFDAHARVDDRMLSPLTMPRVGLYKSYVPTAEEGWTRFIFEQYAIPFSTVLDREIRQGGLRLWYDTIVLPHQPPEQIHEGQSDADYPAEFAGGLGEAGAESLWTFAEQGGTLIAWDGAVQYAIRHLDLQARDVLDGVPESEFYARGSMLRVLMDTTHPVAFGMPERSAVLFSGQNAPAFDLSAGDHIGVYPPHDPLLSGWLQGHKKLAGKTALASVPIGLGRAVLMGFRVQFRAQARGTYKLLFNAILRSAASPK